MPHRQGFKASQTRPSAATLDSDHGPILRSTLLQAPSTPPLHPPQPNGARPWSGQSAVNTNQAASPKPLHPPRFTNRAPPDALPSRIGPKPASSSSTKLVDPLVATPSTPSSTSNAAKSSPSLSSRHGDLERQVEVSPRDAALNQKVRSWLSSVKGLKLENSRSLTHDKALELAIKAAQLSMEFMQIAASKEEKSERAEAAAALVQQAERIRHTERWDPAASGNLIDLDPLDATLVMSPTLRVRVPVAADRSRPPTTTDSPAMQMLNPNVAPPLEPPRSVPASKPVSPSPTRAKSNTFNLRAPKACREIPQDEQVLLWRASGILGGPFPPWPETQGDLSKETKFAFTEHYEDTTSFRLSEEQSELLDGWKRPAEALPPPFSRLQTPDIARALDGPVMSSSDNIDLVQDAATDCSVVASLSAGVARIEHGHTHLMPQLFFPFDDANKVPLVSPNGKYVMRLNFNGCYRKVIIDDRLPVSKNARLLHVIDRNNPCLLWPALLEKAYLKVRGGYDFPGSNSGTDLWILSGWIPEQIFLHHENVDMDQIWERIRVGFSYGDLLITVGTGEITPQTEKALGLVGFHDYAVLDIKEERGQRLILIKNPWVNATTWKGQGGEHNSGLAAVMEEENESSDEEEEDFKSAVGDQADRGSTSTDKPRQVQATPALKPGTFWMPVSNVVQNFSTLYLNWNPGLFKFRSEIHFAWNLGTDRSPFRSFRSNPQFSLTCAMDDQVWLVLEKHFNHRNPGEQQKQEEYISLFAFDIGAGNRVTLNRGAKAQLPFVDSPQTTLRLDMEAGVPLTVVPAEQFLEDIQHTFTLRAFSSYNLKLTRAGNTFADAVMAEGRWTEENSGGQASSVLYSKNPQFALYLPARSRIAVLLETLEEVSVHVKLLHGRGKRITSVMKQDIIVDSGDHTKSCAYAELRKGELLEAGYYTVVCNTFRPSSVASFKLHVQSNVNASLNPIQKEGAGRLQIRLADATFRPGIKKVTAPLVPVRHTAVRFTVKLSSSRGPMDADVPSSLVRLTVEFGTGPERQILLASGAGSYREASGELYTEDFNLQPLKQGIAHGNNLWLTLERMIGAQDTAVEAFQVIAWPSNVEWAHLGVWRDVEI